MAEPRSETQALSCGYRSIVFHQGGSATGLKLGCDNVEVHRMAKVQIGGSLAVDIQVCRLCQFYSQLPKDKVAKDKLDSDEFGWLINLDKDE